MNKKKLLIIGKNSFLGQNLFLGLKKKIRTKLLSYDEFLNLKQEKLKKFNFLCNCSINSKYIKFKYKIKNDIDYNIAKKILGLNINFILLSSRKVYKNKENIKENEYTKPKCNYSKNKLITEKKINKLFKNKVTILRISNVLGLKKKSLRKTHTSFIDNYIKYTNSDKRIYFVNDFKDFITIKQFIKIFFAIIKNNLNGTYNVSLGKKIYINEIIKWLNYKNFNKNKFFIKKRNITKDSFTLNNSKLTNLINIKLKKKEVKIFCKNMGKKIYYIFNHIM
jgi:dTDP-4-dehydrorhamnose reductase